MKMSFSEGSSSSNRRDLRAGLHRGFQNFLRIGAGLQFGFHARAKAVDAGRSQGCSGKRREPVNSMCSVFLP